MAIIYYLVEEDKAGNVENLFRCIETSNRFSTAYFVNGKWKYDATFYKILDNLHEGYYRHIEKEEASEIASTLGGRIDLIRTDENYADKLIDEESRYNAFTETTMPREEADENRKWIKGFFDFRRKRAENIPVPPKIEELAV